LESPAVPAEGATGAQHAVARHHDRHRVRRHGRTDGATRARVADAHRELLVAHDLAEADLGVQPLEHGAAEAACHAPVDGHVEGRPLAGEVLVELPAYTVDPL